MPPDDPHSPAAVGDFRRRLRAEITQWQDDGIITAEQAAAILQRYPGGDGYGDADADPDAIAAVTRSAGAASAIGSRTVSVIAVMGVSLIGLGIIAFVAANWSEMPKAARLALLIGGTPAIYAAGWALSALWGYARVGVAVILLGAIAFGAAIHLIAQIYHLPVNHPNLVPAWFLGVIPLAYIIRSKSALVLSIILFLAAAGFRSQQWISGSDSPALELMPPVYLALGALLFAAGRLQARFADTRQYARIFDLAGLLTVAGVVYALGFRETWYAEAPHPPAAPEYWLTLGLAATAAAVMTGIAGWRGRDSRYSGLIWWEAGAVAAMGLVAAAALLGGAGLAYGTAWLWWAFNLIMLAGILAMVMAGYRWNRAWLINLAVALFAVALFTRYFELGLEFGLLNQSLAFIVTGVILLAGGFGLEFLRRRMLRGMRSDDGMPPAAYDTPAATDEVPGAEPEGA